MLKESDPVDNSPQNAATFQEELTALINRWSMENGSNTPDFILAEYMNSCLNAYNIALVTRTNWYSPKNSRENIQQWM